MKTCKWKSGLTGFGALVGDGAPQSVISTSHLWRSIRGLDPSQFACALACLASKPAVAAVIKTCPAIVLRLVQANCKWQCTKDSQKMITPRKGGKARQGNVQVALPRAYVLPGDLSVSDQSDTAN